MSLALPSFDPGGDKPGETPAQKKRSAVTQNILAILFYSLAMTIGLGVNDLITTIFDSFYESRHIVAKVTYVVILLGVTIFAAVFSGSNVVSGGDY
jgi:hypothetical protein